MRVSAPLQIINVHDKLVYQARVVWCGDSQAGVTFRKNGRLADMTAPSSSHISPFWFERANR
jgi:hypothetical protein